jgi:uncharacterized membrane protein
MANPEFAPGLERHIAHPMIARRNRQERSRRWEDKLADRIADFTGTMALVRIQLVFFGGWIPLN